MITEGGVENFAVYQDRCAFSAPIQVSVANVLDIFVW